MAGGDERVAEFLCHRALLLVGLCTMVCGVAREMAACAFVEIRGAMRGAPGRIPPEEVVVMQIVSSRAAFAGALALYLEREFGTVHVITPDRMDAVNATTEVLVIDCVQNPGAFAAVRRAAFREAAPFVVALVSRPSDFVAEEARQAGARAVLTDSDGLETWSQVLGRIHQHRFQMGPSFGSGGTRLLRLLTRRQAEVFRCVLRGLTDAEIAHELGIAVSTAETHRHDLMLKMGVSRHDRLPLVGVQLGIVDPSELPPPSPLRQASRIRNASV